MDISGKLFGIFIGIHQNRLVAPLQKVPGSFALGIEVHGIGAVDMLHNFGQISQGGFNQQMVVIVHQAVNMDNGAISLSC